MQKRAKLVDAAQANVSINVISPGTRRVEAILVGLAAEIARSRPFLNYDLDDY
jgi:hypothetical protein